jgi:high-affinity Fe2+/Pb2+ permease
MNKSMVWTILGVIAAIVIAWIVVNIVLSTIFFIAKLVLVAIVALIVFGVLRWLFTRRDV